MGPPSVTQALYPLSITHFLMGGFPIKLPSENKNPTITKKIYDGSALLVILILILIYTSYKYHSLSDDLDGALMKFINIIYFTIVLGFTLVSFIWSKIQTKSAKKVWTNLIKIDQDIKNLGIQLNYKSITWSSIRVLSLGFISIHTYLAFMISDQKFTIKFQAVSSYGMLYFGMMNHLAVICSFLTLLRLLSHILSKIVQKTESVLQKSESNCHCVLKKLMCTYHDLYWTVKLVNKIFSAQLLLSFAISFALWTFQTYNTVCSIYNNSPYLKYALASSAIVGTSLAEKFVVTLCCHTCANRAIVLKQVLARYIAVHSTNKKIKKELNAFSLQILHERFEIYAGNMFIVDLPIFTSVCGTATTYIILLWQTDSGVDINASMKKVFGVF